ncbi:biotin/lipoyl-containing protein [Streptomyces sp. XD-27]|uniref:acetyl-CoA carboxylase biotin carboxyl carrier protein n=1 Tax=Streptomyces sp. XD-27 TaxID=3062779 RepID=UPI0026F4447D|nr:biotin/lipoyl-containing protein [Streptomyces sp. XD-27]WKX73257.1 biotin/lipoyl-containing protein [Streptomyces sp. XD-27]
MTSESTTQHEHQTEQHENGHVPGAAARVPLIQVSLESVCRTVAELAGSSAGPPRRVRVQHGQTTVEVEWADPEAGPTAAAPTRTGADTGMGAAAVRTAPEAVPTGAEAVRTGPEPGGPPEAGGHFVCAPTVGTFYRSPEPGAPPFVSVGDTVRAGQPVGILEVMKMMSRVEADTAGRVVEILASDGQPVEFQQRLVRLEPLPGDAGAAGRG